MKTEQQRIKHRIEIYKYRDRIKKWIKENPDDPEVIAHVEKSRRLAMERYYRNHSEIRARRKVKYYATPIEVRRTKRSQIVMTPELRKWYNDYAVMYRKRRSKSDPQWALKRKLTSIVSNAVRRCKLYKRGRKSLSFLGCGLESFKMYIESLWEPGMNWENHGRGKGLWNIDHIIPCAAFDFSKDSHIKYCFHFSNLRPLWDEQNNKKRASVTPEQRVVLESLSIT